MLAFLQEDNFKDDQSEALKQAGLENKDSGGSVEPGEQEYLTVAAKSRNVRKSTILLAVFFVMGLLCLVFMIKKSTPAAASASAKALGTEEAKIEAAIAHLTGDKSELSSGIERIVDKFYEFTDMQQIEVDELARNPFRHEMYHDNSAGELNSQDNDADKIEMIRSQQIARQMKNMQLLSIINSEDGGCCMIDDKVLYEGDKIKDFVVSEISESYVKLRSGNVEIVLNLLK